ncbi:HAD family hydrolase [Pyrofollis japonicus]|uniref:HAD family hydrolase n=1 Tax=Pyrofollis japonicus TaxID=3060460 RepID=UPI00295AA695|nr:HAD family hydrolase [Pyrofollis japonicus]BEP16875.1 HAD family hydrolase [Pyrofollis japonicus]
MENRAIVIAFDVWGTLLRLEPMWGFIAEGLAETTNKPISATRTAIEHVRSRVKRKAGLIDIDHVELSTQLLAEELGASIEAVKKGVARGIIHALGHVEELVYEDAVIGIEAAQELAERTAIVGNALLWPSSYTRLLLEKAGLSRLIDAQVYGDEVGAYKPSPKIWLMMMRALGYREDDKPVCIHVGDSLREDIAGALATGCMAIYLQRRRSKGAEVHRELGVAVTNTLSELRPLVEKLLEK